MTEHTTEPFPHCDALVLHAPGVCRFCDECKGAQNQRILLQIPFSGFDGSPDTAKRPREVIDAWGGNLPYKEGEHVRLVKGIPDMPHTPGEPVNPWLWTQTIPSDINTYQERIEKWRAAMFPEGTADQIALIVCEEAGELAHAVLKESQGLITSEKAEPMIKDALGDIFFTIAGVASSRGWNLNEIIDDVVNEVTSRTKKTMDERYA